MSAEGSPHVRSGISSRSPACIRFMKGPVIAVVCLSGCGGAKVAPEPHPSTQGPHPRGVSDGAAGASPDNAGADANARSTPSSQRPASGSDHPSSRGAGGEKRPVLFEGSTFPPRDPGPVHERSAQPGDGVWRSFFFPSPAGDLKKRVVGEPGEDFASKVAVRTVLHPHEASRFQSLIVAAFDLRALSLHHIVGQADAQDVRREDLVPRSGLVPNTDQSELLAVFNEGFQPRHGKWGMFAFGETLVPPREDGCTVAVLDDGSVMILPWPRMKEHLDRVVAYRQTPPCLVTDGEVHPELGAGKLKRWAGQNADLRTQRRSVVGVSEDGRSLFYGLGGETEADVLAQGIRHAGAWQAAQLDINWNWTRLFLFDAQKVPPAVVGSLEKDMARDAGEYITRPAKRGFFYLRFRQDSAPSSPE